MTNTDSKKILLIDDEEIVLETTGAVLRDFGFDVIARNGVADVAALIEGGNVDVVLTDYLMPGVSGLELLVNIRALNKYVPVILMTGHADVQLAISALQEGAFDFILKPFNIKHLVHSIKRAVRHKELLMMEKDYLRNLEEKVAERTEDIQRALEEIRDARDVAVEACRVKSRFLATISHEIKTPIHGVLGMIELLSGTELTSQQQEHLKLARQSAESLLSLLDVLLDYSRIEAHRVSLSSVGFSLRETIGHAMEPFLVLIRDKELNLHLRISPDVPDRLKGDAVRLRQIINNLAYNAIKFTDRGRIEIGVDVQENLEKGVKLLLTFRDTGTGIPEEQLDVIFDPFTQVDSSNTRRYGGTGLGLSIVNSLVEMMGGSVRVESEMGVGSTFFVTVFFLLDVQDPLAGPPHEADPVNSGLGTVNHTPDVQAGGQLEAFLHDISRIKEAVGKGEETLADNNLLRFREAASELGIDGLAEDVLRVQLSVRRGENAAAIALLDILAGRIETQFIQRKENDI